MFMLGYQVSGRGGADLSDADAAEHAQAVVARANYQNLEESVSAAVDRAAVGVAATMLTPSKMGHHVEDAEWRLLRRTEVPFPQLFLHKRSSLKASELFRNVSLNPMDVVIESAARKALQVAMDSACGLLADMKEQVGAMGILELGVLADAQLARSKSYAEYRAQKSAEDLRIEERELAKVREHLAKLGLSADAIDAHVARTHVYNPKDFFGFNAAAVVPRGDRYFVADERELPKYRDLKGAEATLLLQFAVSITDFFSAVGAIDSAAAVSLVSEISSQLFPDQRK